ncbi:hypothetical protein BZL30_2074 [Mycobacterium kansasii]|uniref:Uncharacterized protein n=1 Tax=Mycobacterium kansasii TaxID=1768 RepID=A0A1V3XHR0_MYCKA|nr:hypothetical protein BZL30_2074 [Mycobacterium kansasii]
MPSRSAAASMVSSYLSVRSPAEAESFTPQPYRLASGSRYPPQWLAILWLWLLHQRPPSPDRPGNANPRRSM